MITIDDLAKALWISERRFEDSNSDRALFRAWRNITYVSINLEIYFPWDEETIRILIDHGL